MIWHHGFLSLLGHIISQSSGFSEFSHSLFAFLLYYVILVGSEKGRRTCKKFIVVKLVLNKTEVMMERVILATFITIIALCWYSAFSHVLLVWKQSSLIPPNITMFSLSHLFSFTYCLCIFVVNRNVAETRSPVNKANVEWSRPGQWITGVYNSI